MKDFIGTLFENLVGVALFLGLVVVILFLVVAGVSFVKVYILGDTGLSFISSTSQTNDLEEIKTLQDRIDKLEQKVERLDKRKANG